MTMYIIYGKDSCFEARNVFVGNYEQTKEYVLDVLNDFDDEVEDIYEEFLYGYRIIPLTAENIGKDVEEMESLKGAAFKEFITKEKDKDA